MENIMELNSFVIVRFEILLWLSGRENVSGTSRNVPQLPGFQVIQGSYMSWKTWKVMEFKNFISRPGKSKKIRRGHGKS